MANLRNGYLFLLFSALLTALGGCAAVPVAPPRDALARYESNAAASYRLDIVSEGGHGSGAVISPDGYIATVDHVGSAGAITVMVEEDGAPSTLTYKARLVASDPINDVAIIKIDRQFRDPVISGTIEELHPGDEVYDVGYPFDYGQMLARGHVMRKHFSESDEYNNCLPVSERIYVHDMVMADFNAGAGTSGSGVYLARNGHLVGLMRLLSNQGRVPFNMVVRAFVPINQLQALAHKYRVPYVQSDGTLKTYPPLPPPKPVKSEATPASSPQMPATPEAAEPKDISDLPPAKIQQCKELPRQYRHAD